MIQPIFVRTELDSPITEVAISIGAYQGDDYVVSGTATFIAPFLAITAKHVVEHYWRLFKRTDFKANTSGVHRELDGNFNMVGIQFFNKGVTGALWDVRKIYFSYTTDIAYLHLVPYSDSARKYKWLFPKIDFLPPKVGSIISAFGYRKSSGIADDEKVKWEFDATTTTGKVIEIHQQKRDDFSINFPSIYTNARFDAGMSGGPVFNEQGKLCGVISANLPPAQEGEEHASYAALIWPSMHTPIDLNRQGIKHSGYYPIFELFQGNFIKCDNLDKVSLTYSEDKKNVSVGLCLPNE